MKSSIKTIVIVFAAISLVIILCISLVIYYAITPRNASSYSQLNNIKYRIMCIDGYGCNYEKIQNGNSKYIIYVYIKDYTAGDLNVVAKVVNDFSITDETRIFCPSILQQKELLKSCYNYEIRVCKTNVLAYYECSDLIEIVQYYQESNNYFCLIGGVKLEKNKDKECFNFQSNRIRM